MGKETLPENHSANWAWVGSSYIEDRFVTARLFFSLQSRAAPARTEQFQGTCAAHERRAQSPGAPEVHPCSTAAALLEQARGQPRTPPHEAQPRAVRQPAQPESLTDSKVMQSQAEKKNQWPGAAAGWPTILLAGSQFH